LPTPKKKASHPPPISEAYAKTTFLVLQHTTFDEKVENYHYFPYKLNELKQIRNSMDFSLKLFYKTKYQIKKFTFLWISSTTLERPSQGWDILNSVCINKLKSFKIYFSRLKVLKNQGRVIRSRGGPTHPPEEFIGCNREEMRPMGSFIFGGVKGANAGDGSSFPASSQVDSTGTIGGSRPICIFSPQRLIGSWAKDQSVWVKIDGSTSPSWQALPQTFINEIEC